MFIVEIILIWGLYDVVVAISFGRGGGAAYRELRNYRKLM